VNTRGSTLQNAVDWLCDSILTDIADIIYKRMAHRQLQPGDTTTLRQLSLSAATWWCIPLPPQTDSNSVRLNRSSISGRRSNYNRSLRLLSIAYVEALGEQQVDEETMGMFHEWLTTPVANHTSVPVANNATPPNHLSTYGFLPQLPGTRHSLASRTHQTGFGNSLRDMAEDPGYNARSVRKGQDGAQNGKERWRTE
jgi:hypothetical protein